MKYQGSKNRIAKHLLPYILEYRTSDDIPYIEPFCGGCNMIDKVAGVRYANDSNKYVIAVFKALQNGWVPPSEVSEELYNDIKNNRNNYPDELVGFAGVPCSYGGMWFSSYARDKVRNYAAEGSRHLIKQNKKLAYVKFSSVNYTSLKIPPKSIVYCDPPYDGTLKYKDNFNHKEFWGWVREISNKAYVYVSEYKAPADFICIKEVLHKTQIAMRQHDPRIERLFVYSKGLSAERPETK